METRLTAIFQGLFGPEIPTEDRPGHLWPRWVFLRALGLIYFSAFYSFLFQVKGLLGPHGILPVQDYLQAVAGAMQGRRFWYAPTLLWLGASNRALLLLCWVGLLASLILVFNLWPRGALALSFASFLSLITVAQDFSSYQSDGMLLEAGFIALFFAPPGFWPGLGRADPPSRASRFLLQWEWFRIYFESGFVKIASGDYSWRHFTAMDDYYQNGPLPTWIGWYVQHFPHWFHASTVGLTLGVELGLVWMLFLPRRFRLACFCIVTPFEAGIILTANYTFLNYLVLSLGFLLLDDRLALSIIPARIQNLFPGPRLDAAATGAPSGWRDRWRRRLQPVRLLAAGLCLGLVFYVATAQLIWLPLPQIPLPQGPIAMLDPFRIANRYGLFAVMTHARYEIEFQGTHDGRTWLAYPYRYKPQDVHRAPGIYAPYQPRFEWNLWFASLGRWQDYRFVLWTEERLLRNDADVLELFRSNPFEREPPVRVQAVIYQYWFTDEKTKRQQGTWWRRELLGEYAPPLAREPDGKILILQSPIVQPPPP